MGGTLTLYTGLTPTPHPIIRVLRVFYDHIYVEDSLKTLTTLLDEIVLAHLHLTLKLFTVSSFSDENLDEDAIVTRMIIIMIKFRM